MIQYVVGLLFTEDHKRVVLLHKARPEWQRMKWNGPGGKVEEGETSPECMSREFLEETGVLVPTSQWEHTTTLIGEDFECAFFRAFSDEAVKDVQTTGSETVATLWITGLHSIPMVNHLDWIIPLQLDQGVRFPIPPVWDSACPPNDPRQITEP